MTIPFFCVILASEINRGGGIIPQNRNTRQKRLILSLLSGNRNHPTADELYELAREHDPHISRGTVYRNLNHLTQTGELRLLTMPSGPNHFDPDTGNHYHFLCRRCDRVFDTPLPYNTDLNATPGEMRDFRAEWHRLLLVGLCPDCARAEERESEKESKISI